jgi:hypothetical protein
MSLNECHSGGNGTVEIELKVLPVFLRFIQFETASCSLDSSFLTSFLISGVRQWRGAVSNPDSCATATGHVYKVQVG